MNKEYIASEYRRMHDEGRFSGGSLKPHLAEINNLVREYNVNSLLDYGCGKALMHDKHRLAKDVYLYDPYYGPYCRKPDAFRTFDMVVCTDVLEHVPEEEVGKVLAELLNYTNKVLFLAICTKPANKSFANGENVHITVKPKEWWDAMLSTAKNIKIVKHYT